MSSLSSAESNPLQSFRWEYRIILLSAAASEVDAVVSELKKAETAIDERDVIWFVFGEASLATNYTKPLEDGFRSWLLERYFKAGDAMQVHLIGKDGGIKEQSDELNLKRLFARIDSMPMRQAEMKRD